MSVAAIRSVDPGYVVSPELVLVDPELRRLLTRFGDTRRPAWEVARHKSGTTRSPVIDEPASAPTTLPDVRRTAREASSRMPKVLALALALLAIGGSTVIGFSSTTTSGTAAGLSKPLSASPTVGQRIAWAPSPDATAYLVELSGPHGTPYHTLTTKTTVVLPTGDPTTGRGELSPGLYTWYVWPIQDGRQAAVPIVRSSLRIPGAADR